MEEALAYISSMCRVSEDNDTVALLQEMVAVLVRGPDSAAYSCLYALANMVDL